MKRELLILASFGCLGMGAAQAQYQSPYGGGYGNGLPGPWQPYSPYTQQGMAPNPYSRNTQPLSPYLNLLRGTGNPAVDYYFGVRPGTPAGQPLGQQQMMNGSNNMMMNSQMRQGYIPQASTLSFEPQSLPDAGKEVVLPPSGHGVGYGNVFGISRTGVPGMNGGGGRNGFFQAPTTGTVKQGTTPKR